MPSFAKRFVEEFLLYSSQFVFFFIVMLALIPAADALTPGALFILTGFLLIQIALLGIQGHNPLLRFLYSFMVPAGYALVRSLNGGFILTDMGNVFLWGAAFYVGLFQALATGGRTRWIKAIAETLLAIGSVVTFVFLYFYLDLRVRLSLEAAKGTIDLAGLRMALDLQAFPKQFLDFLSSPQNAFFAFGGATFALMLLGNKAKVLSLRKRVASLFGEQRLQTPIGRVESPLGEEVSAVVLSSDMLDFTGFSAKLPAARAVDVLNRYYSLWNLVTSRHHGEIVGITGDSVIAVFGLLGSKEAAEEAVAAATDFFAELPGLRDDLSAASLPVFEGVSVGIHAGIIVAGDLGLPGARHIGVFGEAVSVAARLDSLCREFKQELLLSHPVWRQLGLESQARFTSLGEVLLRNSTEPVPVYGSK
jgi:class 3 adenylate cyclase